MSGQKATFGRGLGGAFGKWGSLLLGIARGFASKTLRGRAVMSVILQDEIPYDVTVEKSLPGVAPLGESSWLHLDEAYAAQLARKAELLAERRSDVVALDAGALPAARELLRMVVGELIERHGFSDAGDSVARPGGRAVALDFDDPLGTLAQLVQEDFCILQKQGEEHVLTGALLCFPASWTLAEKFMRPLVRIHKPVESYDANIAKRVQRLFDGVRVGRPVWRFNALHYADAELFHPRTEDAPREDDYEEQRFLRSEKQVILRLPETDAVVFAIHTYVVEA